MATSNTSVFECLTSLINHAVLVYVATHYWRLWKELTENSSCSDLVMKQRIYKSKHLWQYLGNKNRNRLSFNNLWIKPNISNGMILMTVHVSVSLLAESANLRVLVFLFVIFWWIWFDIFQLNWSVLYVDLGTPANLLLWNIPFSFTKR